MIKDPKTIIRRFIIAIGIVSLINSVASIGSFELLSGLALLIIGLSIILSILILVIGIRFNTWSISRPKMLTRFFWAYIVWTVANTLYAYSVGPVGIGAILFTVIYVIAVVYIIRNIKTFASEQAVTV